MDNECAEMISLPLLQSVHITTTSTTTFVQTIMMLQLQNTIMPYQLYSDLVDDGNNIRVFELDVSRDLLWGYVDDELQNVFLAGM